MIIVTTNEIPGYRIEAVLGEVMGMTVRSANFGANFTASFRAIGGGEVKEYTQLVYESRNEVMNRMWHDAAQRGANAVIGMRFDTGDIAQAFSEVCAYGTAVVAVPLAEGEEGATPQSIALAGQSNAPQSAMNPHQPHPGGPQHPRQAPPPQGMPPQSGPEGPGPQGPPQPVMPPR